ncbi:2-succinyl-5-enolpyruvyl-6-hydroxy-3-cyclohexene-1-carboxylic-acid synthase [Kribbella sandramycini]|uniref:2-succinyl-5-enolpyruvyl-6-hydroxy-3-cyclohexene-1-carboxylate synthase n=1 Tax=Kribbella sandramycini TaxID=60450 RepID=A0A7Y4L1E1_9ACTN|nr:2-succinyl-5-enolpyruvyl-6-hydroxy-3-cyclohexene-1-carboxylic-acid synthase [Kribbella sandramycini]MBB6564834.1 2-succinyl-5-enolpyruvyl-6-hydroxy-3-cyclohexene-1-carboxylate synthase [Kribbella sandramycini]NOL42532.1 2-succinyl-5-enolpyruvyl-6-hydroxy-3-cyclohexene-1-carboxylic-acid synthase [Kribbella sandramycini]
MNPSTAFATVVVDELIRCGVREAVVCPGSRSAPLALALAEADRAGRLRLHVRIDERTAGFLAIGLIRGTGLPVPVVTTSGTAVANLHPAVLEASHSGLPLVVLSADRPPALRGTGANQTTDQLKVFGSAVRLFHEFGTPVQEIGQVAYWRSQVARAVANATGARSADPGPVQLNCPLTEPLVPTDGPEWPEPLSGRSTGPWTAVHAAVGQLSTVSPGPKTVVVAGDGASQAARLAAEAGNWPLFAEPSSRARTGPAVVSAYRLLLQASDLAAEIERVLVFGHPTLSRPVAKLLAQPEVEVIVVAPTGPWADPARRAAAVVTGVEVSGPDPTNWLERWQHADQLARPAIDKVLADSLTGPAIAAIVGAAAGADGMLVVASSNPIRDLDLAPVVPIRTVANRGLAGIDGTISTAVGAALANAGPTYALIGDLAFLHDASGLIIGPDEARPDLRIVVVNDNGGGIFSTLEQGDPNHATHFERVFGTPHNTDLSALCAASGTPYQLVETPDALRAALAPTVAGIDVVEARVPRTTHRQLAAELLAASVPD